MKTDKIKDLFRDILILFFFIFAVYYLYVTFSVTKRSNIIPLEKKENINFNINSLSYLFEPKNQFLFNKILNNKFIPFFLLNEPICSTCLNELIEYNSLIKHDTLLKSIECIVLIKTDNIEKSNKLFRVASLDFPYFLIKRDTKSEEKLKSFRDNCLYFYNYQTKKVFYSTLIVKSTINLDDKKKILQNAFGRN